MIGRSNKVEYNGRSLQYARTDDKCQQRFGQKPGAATTLGRQSVLEDNRKVVLENVTYKECQIPEQLIRYLNGIL